MGRNERQDKGPTHPLWSPQHWPRLVSPRQSSWPWWWCAGLPRTQLHTDAAVGIHWYLSWCTHLEPAESNNFHLLSFIIYLLYFTSTNYWLIFHIGLHVWARPICQVTYWQDPPTLCTTLPRYVKQLMTLTSSPHAGTDWTVSPAGLRTTEHWFWG